MSRPKEITETVEIITPVRITYLAPEGRAAAIAWACRDLHLDGYSTQAGGISVKSLKKGRPA